jgi:hypothetical protein
MKYIAVILLACLLVAGTASAISAGPGSAGSAKVIVTPTTPHMNQNPSAYKVTGVVTEAGRGMLEVYSVPSGAIVTLDGNANAGDVTPAKYSLLTGSHTVVISLAGYQDYTETFSLTTGAIKGINADLKRKLSASSALTVMETQVAIKPGSTVTLVNTPGSVTRTTTSPTQTTLFVTTTPPVPWACPNSDWSCLTPAEAGQQFGYPNARYGSEPCGYTPVQNQTIAKYCYMDVDTGGSLPYSALIAGSIKHGDSIYILNETWIQHGVVNKSSLKETGSAAPLQSFFDFFNGILGGSAKPESRLDIVGFNPQPEPPGRVAIGDMNNPENRLNLVGLNPQPEPPAQAPLVQNAK